MLCSWLAATYDDSGYNNYTDVFNDAVNNFAQATVVAGISKPFLVSNVTDSGGPGQRLLQGDTDLSLRSAYGYMGISPKTPQEDASDYYQIDFVSIGCLVH